MKPNLPSSLGLVGAGIRRYRKRRRSLTVALSMVFFLLFAFITFFSALGANLNRYWRDGLMLADLAVPAEEGRVDQMSPVNPAHYFDPAAFWRELPLPSGSAAPRLRFGALIGSQAGSMELEQGLVVVGLDPAAESAFLPPPRLKEGRWLSGRPGEIVLPQAVAGAIGVDLGSGVVIETVTADGFSNMEAATLVGVLDVPAAAQIFGAYTGYLSLPQAQSLVDSPLVSEMVIAPGLVGQGQTRGGFRMGTALSNLPVSRAISLAYLLLQSTVVIFLGIFTIGIVNQNIRLMNEERTAEIGVYLSYGASPAWIRGLMFLELAGYALWCAILGGAAGLAVLGGLTLAGLYPVDLVTDVLMGGAPLSLWPHPGLWLASYGLLLACTWAAASRPLFQATGESAVVKLFQK
jgi:hypothetical protein